MDVLVIGAIVLGILALIIIGNILSDYQIMQNNMAYEGWNSRFNNYGSYSTVGMDIPIKIVVAAALGFAGIALYLMNRVAEKDRKRSRLPNA